MNSLRCLVAPNPSPLTLEGTNTWIWGRAGSAYCVVVDPGPDDPSHLSNIVACCRDLGSPVAAIVLTHDHSDHSEGAGELSRLTGAPVLSGRDGTLLEGPLTVLGSDAPEIGIVSLPGHSSDSVGVVFPEERAIATGDIIFDRGSAMIDWPDGSLRDYLASLDRLRDIIVQRGLTRILPGHGGVITDPLELVSQYHRHRLERLDQVRALRDLPADQIVRKIYGDLTGELAEAATCSVRAQLDYLETR